MAYHLRRQIREAVAAALTGLATTGANVRQSRVYPTGAPDLPVLLVYTLSETGQGMTLAAPRLLQRTVRVAVRALARATANLDDTLDQICKEVEIALAMPLVALAGIAKTITLISTEIEMVGTTDQPAGQATMTFEVVYMNVENAPDVGL